MPTYEYVCEKCEHQFDKFQSISEPALTTCPKELCGMKKWGKGKVKRVIGAGAGLIFKGSGFYITDYRSENYKAAAKKDASSSGVESKAESKAESKPASGGESKTAAAKSESKPAKPKKSGE